LAPEDSGIPEMTYAVMLDSDRFVAENQSAESQAQWTLDFDMIVGCNVI
jgi:hypothetical protein